MTNLAIIQRLAQKVSPGTPLSKFPEVFTDLCNEIKQIILRSREMDKKIKKIEKEIAEGKKKTAIKDLKVLEKNDKKRDKLVAVGKKALKKKDKK